jgi:GT2 family glycosyltransferase
MSARRDDILIVVPTRGTRPDMLARCVESLQRQAAQPRVVVISAAPASLKLSFPAPVTVIQQTSTGLAAAINEAWKTQGGDTGYLGWLGDDDMLPAGSVAEAAAALDADPAASMVHGRCTIIGPDDEPMFTVRSGRLAEWSLAYGHNMVSQPGSLFRARAVAAAGWLDEGLSYAMDLDLYLRLRRQGHLVYVPRVLGYFRRHPGGLTSADPHGTESEAEEVRRRYRSGAAFSRLMVGLARLASRAQYSISRRLPA